MFTFLLITEESLFFRSYVTLSRNFHDLYFSQLDLRLYVFFIGSLYLYWIFVNLCLFSTLLNSDLLYLIFFTQTFKKSWFPYSLPLNLNIVFTFRDFYDIHLFILFRNKLTLNEMKNFRQILSLLLHNFRLHTFLY